MEDDKGEFLNDHVEFFERNVAMLQEEITKWMRGHEKEEQYLQGFKSVMERIAAQEAFAPLGDSLRAMAKSAQILNESTHEVVCERPEKQLLSMLAQVQYQAIVPIKKLLKDRDNARKLQMKLDREYTMFVGKPKAAEKKLRLLKDQKRRVENVDALVDFHMQKLEHFRVSKLKKILQEFTWTQMFYHCKALEALPPASKSAQFIDPKLAVQELSQNIQNKAA